MLTSTLAGDTLTLEGELQVQFLEALRGQLDLATAMPQPLTVDLAEVRDVDLAGLQLLLAFLRSRRGLAPTRLRGAQPALLKAMELSGLATLLAEFID